MGNKKSSQRQDTFIVHFDDDTINDESIYLAELDLLESYFMDELKKIFARSEK